MAPSKSSSSARSDHSITRSINNPAGSASSVRSGSSGNSNSRASSTSKTIKSGSNSKSASSKGSNNGVLHGSLSKRPSSVRSHLGIPRAIQLDEKSSKKAEASKFIEKKIKGHEKKKEDLEEVLKRTKSFLDSRIQSNNTMAAMLSLRQYKKQEAELDTATVILQNLCHYYFQVCSDEELPDNYEDKVTEIMSETVVAPEIDDDSDQVLLKQLAAMGLQPSKDDDDESGDRVAV